VLGHLGSGAEIGIATLDAALERRDPPGNEFNQQVWGRWDALDQPAKRAAFLEADEQLVARFEALDATQRGELPVRLPYLPEPVDVATSVGFRLSELMYHAWDVEVGLDPGAGLYPVAVALLLDRAGAMLAYTGRADAVEGHVTLAVETTDPASRSAVEIGDAVAEVPVPAAVDGVLRIPAEAWLRLTAGRLAPRWTPPGVELTGPLTLDDLRRVFPGF
jgi:hypothetical protein